MNGVGKLSFYHIEVTMDSLFSGVSNFILQSTAETFI